MNRLFNDFGEYIPGFFKISINKELHDGIDWTEFSEQEKATFVHEYVHFLQDISTTRGISNFNYLAKLLQLYFFKANEYTDRITLPIDIEKSNVENAYKQSELISFYSGYDNHIKIHHIDDIKREPDELINDINLDFDDVLYAINIYYNNKPAPHLFGTHCIAESMAYLIERNSFNATERINEFPYNICELICQQVYPQILKNKNILVAICELSLMHYHSGDMFWNLLNHIKNNNLEFEYIDDFELYIKNKTNFLIDIMDKNKLESSDSINFLYNPRMPGMEEVNTVILDYITKGNIVRNNNLFFISRIIESTNPEQYFLNLLNKFTIPILCDSNNQIFSEKDLFMMIVPLALLNFFSPTTSTECILHKYCLEQNNPLIDTTCLKEPWRQCSKDILCPFATYWHFYSLSDKAVIIK